MAKAAYDVLGAAITGGAVITKHDPCQRAPSAPLELFEAGHPVPDENSYRATSRALELVSGLSEPGYRAVPALGRRLCSV